MGSTQAGPPGHASTSHSRPGSRWLLLLAVAAVGLMAVGAGVAVLTTWGAGGTRDDTPTAASGTAPVVVLPAPTPTVAPADRDTSTAFLRALPDEVLAFAVAGQAEAFDLIDVGAVEAYDLTYTDGESALALRAAQWSTAEVAAAIMAASLAAAPADGTTTAPPLREEDVLVGGAVAGRFVLTGDAAAARAIWTNGASLFQVTGPTGPVESFYDAFGM